MYPATTTTTAATISTESGWARVALFGGLLLGLALLALSLPRLAREVAALPAGPAVYAARGGREPGDERVARATRALEHSLRWSTSPALLSKLALLKLVALRSGKRRAPERLLDAMGTQERSLALAPASSDGWARLAYSRYALAGMVAATRAALELSFKTGRLERAPMAFRLQLLLSTWSGVEERLREAGLLQVRELARHPASVPLLVEVYRSAAPGAREIILSALADWPAVRFRLQRGARGARPTELTAGGRRPG